MCFHNLAIDCKEMCIVVSFVFSIAKLDRYLSVALSYTFSYQRMLWAGESSYEHRDRTEQATWSTRTVQHRREHPVSGNATDGAARAAECTCRGPAHGGHVWLHLYRSLKPCQSKPAGFTSQCTMWVYAASSIISDVVFGSIWNVFGTMTTFVLYDKISW